MVYFSAAKQLHLNPWSINPGMNNNKYYYYNSNYAKK